MRLVDLEVHRAGNQLRYSGVWEGGTGGHYLWVNASWDSFRAKWQELAPQGLRLNVGANDERAVAVLDKAAGSPDARVRVAAAAGMRKAPTIKDSPSACSEAGNDTCDYP